MKETENDHRIISVFSNQRMTSHRSISGPTNSLQMAMTGNWNSVSRHKQNGPLCDGHKCGRVKTCGIWNQYICLKFSLWQLWPLIIPKSTSTFPWGQPSIGCLSFWPVSWLIKGSAFYWWLKVTERPWCALAVPALIPNYLPRSYTWLSTVLPK